MKFGIAIVASAVTGALVMAALIGLRCGLVSNDATATVFVDLLPVASIVSLFYAALVGTPLHLTLRKFHKDSHLVYAIVGGIVGISFLLVPMAIWWVRPSQEQMLGLVSYALMLICTGAIVGLVYRFSIVTYERRKKDV